MMPVSGKRQLLRARGLRHLKSDYISWVFKYET